MENKTEHKKIDISISTINWNTADKLKECIDSFLNTYNDLDYEWFIIDNNSQGKDFDDIIYEYSINKNLIFIKNNKNEGLAVLNKIIDRVRGRYWVFLDPDTLQKGKPIKALIEFMDSKADAGIASAQQFNPDGSPLYYYGTRFNLAKIFFRQTRLGRFIDYFLFSHKMRKYHSFSRTLENRVTEVFSVPFGCTIERTDLIHMDGYVIDPNFTFYYNDVDLCKRVWDKGYKIYVVPVAEIIHDHSTSYKKRKTLWKEMELFKCEIKYFRKHHKYKLWIVKALLISEIMISMFENKLKGKSIKKLYFKFRNILKW